MNNLEGFDGSCPTCGQTDGLCPPGAQHDDPPVPGGYTGSPPPKAWLEFGNFDPRQFWPPPAYVLQARENRRLMMADHFETLDLSPKLTEVSGCLGCGHPELTHCGADDCPQPCPSRPLTCKHGVFSHDASLSCPTQAAPAPDYSLPSQQTNTELGASIGRLCERVAGLETDVVAAEAYRVELNKRLSHEAANGMSLLRRIEAVERCPAVESDIVHPDPVIVATAFGTQQVEVGYETVELCSCPESAALRRSIERIGRFARDHEIGDSSKLSRIREECALILRWE